MRDMVLRENLRYPDSLTDSLQELVDRQYLRALPVDPVFGTAEHASAR